MLGRKTYRKEEEEGGWGFNDTFFLLWLEPWKGRGVLWNVGVARRKANLVVP